MNSRQEIRAFIDKLVARGLESWQVAVVRNALHDEYIYDHGSKIAQLIAAINDSVGNSPDRNVLSQFLHDKSYYEKNEDGSYVPTNQNLKLILEYLLDPETGRLTKSHFEKEELSHLVPSVLAEFLSLSEARSAIALQSYEGLFVENISSSPINSSLISYFDIKIASGYGYFNIAEIIRNRDNNFDIEGNLLQQLFVGWGVFAENEKLLILVKNSKLLESHCFTNIELPLKNSDGKIQSMRLLSNKQYIPELWSSPESDSLKDISLAKKITLVATRTYEFSCKKNQDAVMVEESGSEKNVLIEDKRKKELPLHMRDVRLATTHRSNEERDVMNEKLGMALIRAAIEARSEIVSELLSQDAPIDFQDPRTGMTAIHIAAYCSDIKTINVLLAHEPEPNLLIRDKKNLLPSTCAATGTGLGDTLILANRLRLIEKRQGEKVGVAPRINGDVPLDDGPGGMS